MKIILSIFLLLIPFWCVANEVTKDSIYYVDAVEVTAIKQALDLRREPIASTTLQNGTITANQIVSIKDLQYMVPNFYMPDYGSRITSSIYVRGLGARIDQPVVGLNINNVPYLNKNAFDTDVMDITRMEILRGPQSTLYGRNTMCGVVNIYTLSPMDFEGVKLNVGYGNGNTYNSSVSVYEKFSDRFAASINGYYSSTDGFYKNLYTYKTCDTEEVFGGDIRMIYLKSERTTIDNTTSFSVLEQGGYPYRWIESGEINYNDICSYDRTLISNGLTVSHKRDNVTLSSITSYQYLNDNMILDQDFTPESIFTLKQAIQEHSLTEDIVLRSNKRDGYNYLLGVFGFYKNQAMSAPVTFLEQGINELILDNLPGGEMYEWNSDSFVIESDFRTNTIGAALYHESSIEINRWSFKGALRLDYEIAMLKYNSTSETGATQYNDEGGVAWEKDLNIDLSDNISMDFLEFLPKVSATYNINERNSLYASVAKGYKAGGYNTQMFSDILTQEMMRRFGLSSLYTPEEIITYKPEYSWNYEIGGHFTNNNRTLRADLALFYIDCRDQQLTIFPEDMVTGRLMTNAWHSRSFGSEFSVMARHDRFTFNASYGYTNAKFIEYNDNEEDYADNYLPYAPQQTLYASLQYTIPINKGWLREVDLEANTNGVGTIYWNESNTLSQPFYALVGGSVTLSNQDYRLSIWGRNLTDKSYDTFYFMSMENEFMQSGLPTTFGVALSITIK